MMKLPIRYLPISLSKKDKLKQIQMLSKSRKLYKQHKYFTRKTIKSYQSKESKHMQHARQLYHLQTIVPSKELSKATGCSINALQNIVRKGEGAYYSSGSRPNQTPQSWGYARLASAITGQKAAAVDYHILHSGCNPQRKAFQLARDARRKYNNGRSKTRLVDV